MIISAPWVVAAPVLFLVMAAGMSGCSDVCPPSSDGGGQDGYVLPCLLCHDEPVGRRRAIVDESGGGGHTFGADVFTPELCLLCHEMTQHAEGIVRLWEHPGRQDVVIEVADNPTREPDVADEVTELCLGCHVAAAYDVHAVRGDWQPACITCHNLHDPASHNLALVADMAYNQTLAIDLPVAFTARTGPRSFADGEPLANDGICQVCHTSTAYHRYDGSGALHNAATNCTMCHPHAAGFLPTSEGSCIACHSSPQDNGDGIPVGGRPMVVNADGTGGHHIADDRLTDDQCVICHEMSLHQQGVVRLWVDPSNPTTPLPVAGDPQALVPFCSSCHDALTHPAIHATGAAWEPACTECHELHDPTNANLSLVHDVVRNETLGEDKPVIFTSRWGANSFDDGDPAQNDGICQVCHTTTTYHRHDGTGRRHNNGLDCTACHPHPMGFAPTGGSASCTRCHTSGVLTNHHLLYDRPIPSRSVVPFRDSDRNAVPDPRYGCLSCHDDDLRVRRDCTVCHSASNPHDATSNATAGN